MNFLERTALPVVIILALYYAFSYGNCNNQEKGSFEVVGVFDFADVSSQRGFENATSRHNSLSQEECIPRLTYSMLLIKSEMSVSELIDLAHNRLKSAPCFMVYAAEDKKARIVLDFAINQGLNVLTAIPQVSMSRMITKSVYYWHEKPDTLVEKQIKQ